MNADGEVEEARALPRDLRALIAIDLGAESCRVSLLRWAGGTPAIELVHRFANGPVAREDGLYWDLDRIVEGVGLGIERCAAQAPEGIRSLAVDGWAVDYVRLDEQGEPVAAPHCYRDQRTVAAWESVHERLPQNEMQTITGIQLMRINTLYQLVADSAEQQQLRWLNLPEYLLYRLGGEAVAEYTNASHTQLLDLGERSWSRPILHRLELPESSFAPVVATGTCVGQLRGPLAMHDALRNTRLIATACHDTASAIAGIPAHGDDWAYISSGTWSLVGTLLDRPVNTALTHAENFTNLGAAGDRICFHKNVNGMWLMRQCMETWAQEAPVTLAELLEAAATQPRPEFLLDVDEPELLLPGDMPTRIQAQMQRRGLPPLGETVKDAAAMVALILHSLAQRYAVVLRKIEAITGKTFRRIYVVGGGSRNQLLNRLTAEATGLQVIAGCAESSTLGNFAIQMSVEEDGCATREAVGRWAGTLLPAM
jgi:rhamnulokinase